MTALHERRFFQESEAYRKARNELLKQELELDRKINELGQLRKALPLGGKIKEDYLFEGLEDGQAKSRRMSDLFRPGKDTLLIYSFMYGGKQERPCPACTSLIDGFNGTAQHILDRINLVVAAKAPIAQFTAFAEGRSWSKITLLSSEKTTYNLDYFAETPEGVQLPAINVYTRKDGSIHHFYNAEMLYVKRSGHPRHADRMWPIWNILDITPEGRGTDWHPKLDYA